MGMMYGELLRPPMRNDPELPLVSFLIMTYGRAAKQPHILNECVWWCCEQDYPNVEVVVLNDAPGQIVSCTCPKVKVVNWPTRIPDLGTKMDILTLLASGSICCVNDDDDISLPWRARQAVDMLGDRYEYWAPRMWIYGQVNKPTIIDGNGYSYNCAAFRRESMLGNHPKVIKGHDMEAAGWAAANLQCNPEIAKHKDVSFIYRWGVSQMHLSGCFDPVEAFKRNEPGPIGSYEIVPAKGSTDWAEEFKKLTATPQLV